MIILDGKPKNAIIYLNQEKILTTLPGKITNLFPGDYEITISYQGYKPWQKSITVLPGKASAYQNIILFLETPENISEPLKINLEDFKNEAQNNTQEIELLGAEIYLNKRLITRFSQNITAAFVFPDKYHLVVQIENEILIIDLDGSNIQSLFKLTFKTPTSIVFRDSGKTIYYLKDDQIYGKIIQK
ncbi:MAG: PEGA domain-containing protein [Patescibacteria group bacterium]